ncbi:hypothetical protein ACJBQ0_12685, partial [Streptococcus suis]
EHVELGVNYYLVVIVDTTVEDFKQAILPIHTVRFFEEEQLESLQVIHAIRDNILLNQVADIDIRQKLLSADIVTNLFSN